MKKIISVLFLALVVSLFSSCIIIDPNSKFTFYFYNDTNTDINDFYLRTTDDEGPYAKYKNKECPVEAGDVESIPNLEKDYYYVFYNVTVVGTDVILCTENCFYLNSDTTFRLKAKNFLSGAPRSAESINTENLEEMRFVLEDSAGNEYSLIESK